MHSSTHPHPSPLAEKTSSSMTSATPSLVSPNKGCPLFLPPNLNPRGSFDNPRSAHATLGCQKKRRIAVWLSQQLHPPAPNATESPTTTPPRFPEPRRAKKNLPGTRHAYHRRLMQQYAPNERGCCGGSEHTGGKRQFPMHLSGHLDGPSYDSPLNNTARRLPKFLCGLGPRSSPNMFRD